jgi:large subunit ribosomal protein L10
MVQDIGDMISGVSFIYFVKYKGLSVTEFSKFRNELAGQDTKCRVLKNSLIKKAVREKDFSELKNIELSGDTAMIFGSGDAGAIAKVIEEFSRKNNSVEAKSGYMEGMLLSGADIKDIASLPSKEVLQSQLIGVIQAPARNLASVLNAKVSSILNVINAYKNKLEEQ